MSKKIAARPSVRAAIFFANERKLSVALLVFSLLCLKVEDPGIALTPPPSQSTSVNIAPHAGGATA
jgi:hypothetical protein